MLRNIPERRVSQPLRGGACNHAQTNRLTDRVFLEPDVYLPEASNPITIRELSMAAQHFSRLHKVSSCVVHVNYFVPK